MSSFIPIDRALGGDARECLVLALLALVPFLYRGPAEKRGALLALCGGVLLLALNPWCARLVAAHTHAVMSWRWIWIAPLPAFTAALLAVFWGKRYAAGVCAGLALLFLCVGPWTCRSGNMDFHFARPQWKLPREYAEVRELAALLPPASEGVNVLAPGPQAAWLPVVRPGLGLVMGGHTQKGSYARLMGRREHAARLVAQSFVEERPDPAKLDLLGPLLGALRVTHCVVPRDAAHEELAASLRRGHNARLVGATAHFAVYQLPGPGRPPGRY